MLRVLNALRNRREEHHTHLLEFKCALAHGVTRCLAVAMLSRTEVAAGILTENGDEIGLC